MVVGTLLLSVALAVGGLAQSPIYREHYAYPQYPGYQAYQPVPSVDPRAYTPLSSYYQSGATSPPVYQPTEAPVESAKTLFQPVQYLAAQYQPAAAVYQPYGQYTFGFAAETWPARRPAAPTARCGAPTLGHPGGRGGQGSLPQSLQRGSHRRRRGSRCRLMEQATGPSASRRIFPLAGYLTLVLPSRRRLVPSEPQP
ncbi:hypothetical protein C7M84_010989 [Penaeus vannamei]|uniref:Uncharacterized protein n=1 Tax=Penaeus vannamei TaxID=6689 RepID=A0A423T2J2_PENVA|nr:hypothetical protein C7M84_010989 [Penaeus vannamei]